MKWKKDCKDWNKMLMAWNYKKIIYFTNILNEEVASGNSIDDSIFWTKVGGGEGGKFQIRIA